ncbi:Cell Wall Hydrolase [Halobacteroides halobius DSM 5150]|uniref:Cell Wall Hydrolase n=1 Tax=Halobacteroides halobius (strain ATCC 35273 / DSM 5150 / MD-1) TaxID=748449 RepID=L0K7C4_HALHC|nr:cell wall hydrolase [Halobacteroides halobius]AGB40440.1 Cell Wall Hydrolase [Halobacteroides halobius DSM 5150]
MKKLGILVAILAVIGTGVLIYETQSTGKLEKLEAAAPSFWSLSPKMRLMTRTVSAEAKGESLVGQVAVAAVILNRVDSSKFPDSISGVIYQPWAFTAVARGHIWNNTPDERTIRATLAAKRGWDPTYGSIYYYNPAKVETNWIYTRNVVRRIGKHIFAK